MPIKLTQDIISHPAVLIDYIHEWPIGYCFICMLLRLMEILSRSLICRMFNKQSGKTPQNRSSTM